MSAELLDRLREAFANRYAVERELGEGGMATVYLATDLKHHRQVAIKVLRPELAAVLGAERFVQEIKTTANLQHPHILPLFDSGEADGFLYYVMPFIDGESLRDKLNRETQLGVEEAVKITTEVADALDYAHRQNVIHRDIKPENILLHDGRPMVADFGIALAVSAAAGGRKTETGLSLGTPHYMSPEQATAEKDITARSDLYSLGSVLYEMLTGEPPHTGGSAQAIIMKIVTEPADPVTKIRKSVPAHVAAATAKSLEKLAADRFESAAKFAEALTNPAFTLPTTRTTMVAGVQASWQWNRLSIAATALTAVAIVVALWGWLRPQPEVPKPVSRYSVAIPEEEALFTGFGTR
ncbi:MAG: serine/threonine-protein kinase, partial [Planctomycetota bacterium]